MNIFFEVAGYLASALVAASFYMKTIIPLRLFAITSNVVFIVYGIGAGLYPVIVLHTFLFPLNILRLLQMKRLIKNVKEASDGSFSLQSLIPYMSIETIKKGDVLFRKGDLADKMYYLCKGRIELVENEMILDKGHLLGEMGIFSPLNRRTGTAICMDDDMKVYSITEKGVKQLYYQNPEFGFYLVKLITGRFISGVDKENSTTVRRGKLLIRIKRRILKHVAHSNQDDLLQCIFNSAARLCFLESLLMRPSRSVFDDNRAEPGAGSAFIA